METEELIRKYNSYRNSTINLQASENILSQKAASALSSDMASRYSLFVDGYNAYGGTYYFDKILEILENNVKKLFGSPYSESRALSGHIAAEISIISALSNIKNNKNVMAINESDGGYPGYQQNNMGNMLGFNFHQIPYENYKIKYEELESAIKTVHPGIIILGQSVFIMPYDMVQIHEMAEKYGIKILYDASHVMGLIAGGSFQPDAMKYSDIVYGSTHKTFFGPQGGIILT
ncbi:MAG: serine hydroxymethyltransferase, partial [Ferroplasma sp.]